MCVAASLRSALLLSLGLLAAAPRPARTQEAPALPSLRDVPIDLDAAYSELDRRENRLLFRQLRISQGPLSIVADEAEANPADFSDSVWTFRGNVVIENTDAKVWCDEARMEFRENQLRRVQLTGAPARFEQRRVVERAPTQGKAGAMDYDLEAGLISMSEDAWLSDGQNEITGARIAYDLRREYVTATGEDGQVRMRIAPPAEAAPEAAPEPTP